MKTLLLFVCAFFGLAIFQDWASRANAKATNAESANPAKTVRTFFVDGKNGVDTKDCDSEQKPCKKIQYVINNANKAEEILIRVKASGVYDESISINRDNITLLGSDKKDAPKPTLKAQKTGRTITIKGTNITIEGFEITNGDKFLAGTKNGQTAIFVEAGSKVIKILNNYIHTIGQEYGAEGCCFEKDKKGKLKKDKDGKLILMTNCPCSGQAHAIKVDNYTTDEVSDLSIIGNTISNLHLGQSEAISISGNVSKFLVKENTIRNVDNIAIDILGKWGECPEGLKCQASGNVINNDVSYVYADQNKANSSTADGCNRNPQYNPGQGDNSHTMGAIYVDGGTDVTIDRNKVYCSATGIDFGSENSKDNEVIIENIIVKNNLVYNNYSAGVKMGGGNKTIVKDSKIFNNTFINNNRDPKPPKTYDEYGTILFAYKNPELFRAIEISNNIIINTQARPLISNFRKDGKNKAKFFKNNLLFSMSVDIFTNDSDSFSTFVQWINDTSNVFLTSEQFKSLFLDFDKYNFELRKGSFAIDKGDKAYFENDCKTCNCIDFLGKPRLVDGIDIGAFEYQK